MIGFSKMAYQALEVNGRIPSDPRMMWKMSKPATIWVFLCMVVEIPLTLLKYMVKGICFIPHEIYDALDL